MVRQCLLTDWPFFADLEEDSAAPFFSNSKTALCSHGAGSRVPKKQKIGDGSVLGCIQSAAEEGTLLICINILAEAFLAHLLQVSGHPKNGADLT